MTVQKTNEKQKNEITKYLNESSWMLASFANNNYSSVNTLVWWELDTDKPQGNGYAEDYLNSDDADHLYTLEYDDTYLQDVLADIAYKNDINPNDVTVDMLDEELQERCEMSNA
jgi:hypothetical protein